MKKEIKVVAIVLVALIVFLAGFGLGATKGININIGSESGINVNVNGGSAGSAQVVAPVTQTPTTATPVVTDAPTTAAPTPSGDTTTTAAPSGDTTTTAAPSGDGLKVPATKEEVAAAYNKALNAYRAYTGKVTTKKTETIDIGVTDLPAAAAAVVNKVVESFTGTTTNEWTFENGADVADPNRKLADKIIPGGRDAAVDPAGLVSGTATANADGGYTMTMVFVAEDSNFDGTQNTSNPTYHMGAMDPLNLGSLDLGPITISEAKLHYPGATLEATVDGQGRLVKLSNKLPLEGFGTGKAVISLTINLAGSMDSLYEMTYA